MPVVESLDPAFASRGSGSIPVSVIGSGFVPRSTAKLNNGTNLETTFVSETLLVAQLPGARLDRLAFLRISAFNPSPGGGTSDEVRFVVGSDQPPTPRFLQRNVAIPGETTSAIFAGGASLLGAISVEMFGSGVEASLAGVGVDFVERDEANVRQGVRLVTAPDAIPGIRQLSLTTHIGTSAPFDFWVAGERWLGTGSKNFIHSSPRAVRLPSGKVLILGYESAELYDPITGIWQPIPAHTGGREKSDDSTSHREDLGGWSGYSKQPALRH